MPNWRTWRPVPQPRSRPARLPTPLVRDVPPAPLPRLPTPRSCATRSDWRSRRRWRRADEDPTVLGRAAWLNLLVEATAVADDERIAPAVERLLAALQAEWPGLTRIDEVSASVEACLRAAAVVDSRALVQDAIDHLERVIGGAYRPGEGLVRDRGGVRTRCDARRSRARCVGAAHRVRAHRPPAVFHAGRGADRDCRSRSRHPARTS